MGCQLWPLDSETRIWPPLCRQEGGRLAARSLRRLVSVEDRLPDLLMPGWFDELFRALHVMGFRDRSRPRLPRNLWVFVYDWTRSNRVTGQALAAFVREILQTHNSLHPQEPWSDVDVVCHSMGGLVTRAAINLFGAPVRRTVYLASPHYGASLAYFALRSGVGGLPMAWRLLAGMVGVPVWRQFLRQPDDFVRLEEQLSWLVTRLPSVYELLPDEFYLTETRPVVLLRSRTEVTPVIGAADTYLANPASRFDDPEHRERVEAAMAFKRELGRELPGESLVIYSASAATPDQVVHHFGRFGSPYDSGQHGDEVVPAASAAAGPAGTPVQAAHGALPNVLPTHLLIDRFLQEACERR